MTSKDRANFIEKYYKEIQPDTVAFNQKRQKRDGNFLKVVQKMEHKHQPMHRNQFDEHSRVTDQIKIHGRDYLPESFNLEMYRYPSWKDNKKELWLTPKGFDNKTGINAAHVLKI
jgi:hypothetical protein